MKFARWIAPVLLFLLAWLGQPAEAWAHQVETDFSFDLISAQLEFVSTFSTGEPMASADVTVYAPGNREEPWFEGKTDEAGRFAFLPDASQTGEWRIEFRQEGHADIWTVPVGEAGIQFDEITDGLNVDRHYAAFPSASLAAGLAGGAIGGSLLFARRKFANPTF
ncbi:MAG: carboxypeptidase regulatory-like domain-containing protein [Elainellaceae cyanobacterium]